MNVAHNVAWVSKQEGSKTSASSKYVARVRRRENNRVATNLGNSGNLKNCENLRESSGKFELLYKKPGNSGEMKNMWHDDRQKCTSSNFSPLSCPGKKLKIIWKSQGKVREFSF